jgi:integrase
MARRRDSGDGLLRPRIIKGVQVGWVGALWVGGERRWRYGKTKEEVKTKLKALTGARDEGRTVPKGRWTVDDFINYWLEKRERDLRPRTLVRYRELLTLHVSPTLGKMDLRRLSTMDIDSLYAAKLKEGKSATTVGHLHAVLQMMLDNADALDLVPRNVARLATPPRPERFEGKELTGEEAARLLAATANDRLSALWRLAIVTGMRQGELLGLTWGAVDLEAATLTVKAALQRMSGEPPRLVEPKTETSKRTIPLMAREVTELRRHRARQKAERLAAGKAWDNALDLVFTNPEGRPLWYNAVEKRLTRLLDAEALPKLRFHDLRRSCASILLGLGVNPKTVSELLGHSKVSMTLDVYSRSSPGIKRAAVEAISEHFDAQSSSSSCSEAVGGDR